MIPNNFASQKILKTNQNSHTFIALPVDMFSMIESIISTVTELNSSSSTIEWGSAWSITIPSKHRISPPRHRQQFARMFIKLWTLDAYLKFTSENISMNLTVFIQIQHFHSNFRIMAMEKKPFYHLKILSRS